MTLIGRIKVHEGFRDRPYRDTVGKLTIGYGRNLDDKGIDEEEADYLLQRDLDYASRMARIYVPGFEEIDEARQGVLVEMIFNMGLARFLDFRRMLMAARRRDWPAVAAEMADSRWHKQVGQRARTLEEIMISGTTQD